MVVLSIFSGIFFYINNTSIFFIGIYFFISWFCEYFTCLSSKIQNAIKLENISNLNSSPSSYQCIRRKTRLVPLYDVYKTAHTIILNSSIFSVSAVHNKSGCSDVTPAVKLPCIYWRTESLGTIFQMSINNWLFLIIAQFRQS
jgi:hypothetical protein